MAQEKLVVAGAAIAISAFALSVNVQGTELPTASGSTASDCASLRLEIKKGHKLNDEQQETFAQCPIDKPARRWLATPPAIGS
jgi:hypothetical protein